MTNKHPVAYLDADILLHRACAFTEHEYGGEEISLPIQATYFFNSLLESWLEQVGKISDYFLIVSNGKNFRHVLFDQYKANRKDIKPHPAFAGMKAEVMSYQMTQWEDGIEADDLIGIRVTENPNTIAVSADKDFATVPCTLFIPASHGKPGSWHTFTEDQANHNWLLQAMTGDVTDNYAGIPKVGPVKALAVIPALAPVDQLWIQVEAAFVAKGQTKEYALLMARLARILRHGEYNFETKEVRLWSTEAVVRVG